MDGKGGHICSWCGINCVLCMLCVSQLLAVHEYLSAGVAAAAACIHTLCSGSGFRLVGETLLEYVLEAMNLWEIEW